MKKDNCPCKDCPKKGCGAYHDICEKYQAFRAEKEKENEERINGYSNYKKHPKKKELKWNNYHYLI